MNYLSIIIKIIGTIGKLMQIAEKAFDDIPDSGVQKKEMVVNAVKAIVEGLSGVTFTEELWKKILIVVNPLIDIFAGIFFPHEK